MGSLIKQTIKAWLLRMLVLIPMIFILSFEGAPLLLDYRVHFFTLLSIPVQLS